MRPWIVVGCVRWSVVVAADAEESCFGDCCWKLGVDAIPGESDVFANLCSGVFVAESEDAERDFFPGRVERCSSSISWKMNVSRFLMIPVS